MPQTKNQKRESAIIRMQAAITRLKKLSNELGSDSLYSDTGRLQRISTKTQILERDISNTLRNIRLNVN